MPPLRSLFAAPAPTTARTPLGAPLSAPPAGAPFATRPVQPAAAPLSAPPAPTRRGAPRGRGSHAPEAAVRAILDAALSAERLAITFYYTGLTTRAIMRQPRLGGRSLDPNNPGLPPDGDPHNVRYLQAALDAEARHAALLSGAGADVPPTRFVFPAATFARLGHAGDGASFLGVLDHLETTMIGLYLAAVAQFCALGRADLAETVAGLGGVEAEHRMLGRVIARIAPANNLTLELDPFAEASAALAALHPFLGHGGFAGGSTRPIALPSPAHVRRVVGKYGTRHVSHFL